MTVYKWGRSEKTDELTPFTVIRDTGDGLWVEKVDGERTLAEWNSELQEWVLYDKEEELK